MIVVSPSVVLAQGDAAYLPVIGYRSVVTTSNVSADSSTVAAPVTNLANPSTALLWQSASTATQYVTVTLEDSDIDYVGVARHNFGTSGIQVTVQTEVDSVWGDVAGPVAPADNRPLLFRFTKHAPSGVRLKLENATAAPYAAVLYVGELLTMELGIQVGFTPLNLSRSPTVRTGRSESGNFLGRVVTKVDHASRPTFRMLSAGWVRDYLDPFLEAAIESPFFFAWAPQEWPLEVGYAWLDEDASPSIAVVTGHLEVELPMKGVV